MEEIVFCIISIWLKGWKNGKIENMSFLPLLVGQKKGRKEKLLYFKLPLYLYIIYFKFINEGKICYIFFFSFDISPIFFPHSVSFGGPRWKTLTFPFFLRSYFSLISSSETLLFILHFLSSLFHSPPIRQSELGRKF